MRSARVIFVASCALAIAAACGGATQNGTGGGGGDDGGGGGTDGTSGDDGSSNNDGNAGNDGAAQDTGGGGKPIQCGPQLTCDSATQVCCIDPQSRQASCAPIGQCQGFSLACTSALSCNNGEVCCGTYSQQDGVQSACAQPPCPQGLGNFQLCATDAECPKGERCLQGPGGGHICRPPFDGGFGDGGPKFDAGGPG